MVTSRTLKWTLLTILIMATFFLASFNATLRYIVDQRREISLANQKQKEAAIKSEERKVWEEEEEEAAAKRTTKDAQQTGLAQQKRRRNIQIEALGQENNSPQSRKSRARESSAPTM